MGVTFHSMVTVLLLWGLTMVSLWLDRDGHSALQRMLGTPLGTEYAGTDQGLFEKPYLWAEAL
jgi:hypothetical protein